MGGGCSTCNVTIGGEFSTCDVKNCNNPRINIYGYHYCSIHVCHYKVCKNFVQSHEVSCKDHQCKIKDCKEVCFYKEYYCRDHKPVYCEYEGKKCETQVRLSHEKGGFYCERHKCEKCDNSRINTSTKYCTDCSSQTLQDEPPSY